MLSPIFNKCLWENEPIMKIFLRAFLQNCSVTSYSTTLSSIEIIEKAQIHIYCFQCVTGLL